MYTYKQPEILAILHNITQVIVIQYSVVKLLIVITIPKRLSTFL